MHDDHLPRYTLRLQDGTELWTRGDEWTGQCPLAELGLACLETPATTIVSVTDAGDEILKMASRLGEICRNTDDDEIRRLAWDKFCDEPDYDAFRAATAGLIDD